MKILFLSSHSLPDQSANATRIINLAKLTKQCSHEPILLGIRLNEAVSKDGDCDGFKYMNVDAVGYYSVSKMKRAKFVENLVLQKLEEIWKETKFELIVLSEFAYQSIGFIMRFAKKNNIAIAINSVEWYEKNNATFDGVGGKIKYIYNRYGMHVEHVKCKNIIGISSLLTEHYRKKGCNVVRIPTIIDKDKYEFVEQNNNEKTIIAYAGSPGRKDYVVNAIRALTQIEKEEREKVEFHLYGATESQLMKLGLLPNEVEELRGILFAHGRIPYVQVQSKIASADFTILLRPNLRYANAGFPTKVGESMMCGTPVIANHTSDLNLYIRDNDTGIVAADETVESCIKGIRRAIKMTGEEKKVMRQNARDEAEKSLYFGAYEKEMKEFLEGLKNI